MKLLLCFRQETVMDYFLLIGSLTLFVQIGVFFLLIGGFLFRKQRKFRAHGFAMFTGVILHLITILGIMVPSFVEGLVPHITSSVLDVISILTIVHVGVGISVALLGVWIVFSWGFRKSLQFCAPKRRWMKLTFWSWLLALALGFLLYLSLFWSLLFS